MNTQGLITLSLVAIAAGGCARSNCIAENSSQFWVPQATFQSPTKVEFCTGGRETGVHEITVYPGQTNGYTSVTHDRNSRYDGSCSDFERKRYESIPVALTSKSFDQYKLCYVDGSLSSIHLLAINEACPQGTKAQERPVDDCSAIALP